MTTDVLVERDEGGSKDLSFCVKEAFGAVAFLARGNINGDVCRTSMVMIS
jgi:hypothetical protein